MNYFIFLFIFILLLFFILFIYLKNYEKEKFELDTLKKEKLDCVCVFDIDDTLTCGFENANKSINECLKNKCKIAINTARTSPYYDDLDLYSLGLTEEMFKNDIFYGTWNKDPTILDLNSLNSLNSLNMNNISVAVAKNKVSNLQKISKKYNIDPSRTILFDDNINNIEAAKKNKFSTIYANHNICGIPNNTISQIRNILKIKIL